MGQIIGDPHEQFKLSKIEKINELISSDLLKSVQADWSVRNFGPIFVPRKNSIIFLTPRLAILFKRIIEWETHKKMVINLKTGNIYLGGKLIKYYRFISNYYFLVGDNVLSSYDSRYWGFVPEDYIIGVVSWIS